MIKQRYSTRMALLCASLLAAGCSETNDGDRDSAPLPQDLGIDVAAEDQGQEPRPDQALGRDSSPDAVSASTWQKVSSPSNGQLQAIWGSGADNIFVVGKEGYILRYDGNSWKSMASPTSNDLLTVWGQEHKVYAAGANVILVLDQSVGLGDAGGTPSWKGDYTSSWTALTFRGIWGTDAGDLYAVGEKGEIRSRAESSSWWSTVNVPTDEHLNAITGFGQELFVVGDKGTILHRVAGEWQQMDAGAAVNLTDLWGTGPDDVYVSGLDGVVLHYDGAAWSKLETGTPVYFRAIWGSAGDNLYVAGESLFGEDEEAVLHYDGSSWEAIGAGEALAVLDLWGSSADNLYALTRMNILRYNPAGQ